MRQQAIRMMKIILGWLFLILGVVGLFLPILQGFLFLAVGLAILAQEQAWAHGLLQRLRRRFPQMVTRLDHARHKAEAWVGRIVHRKPEDPPG